MQVHKMTSFLLQTFINSKLIYLSAINEFSSSTTVPLFHRHHLVFDLIRGKPKERTPTYFLCVNNRRRELLKIEQNEARRNVTDIIIH